MAASNKQCTTQHGESRVGSRILLNYIEATASNSPDKTAIQQLIQPEHAEPNQPHEVIVSYLGLFNAINYLSWQLDNLAIKPNGSTVIAYLGPSDLRHLLISLVATKMGKQALLISPRVSISMARYLLELSNSPVMVFESTFSSTVDEISKTRSIQTFQIQDLVELLRGPKQIKNYPYDGSWATLRSTPAVILHTSGSTGIPRLVPISHSSLAASDAQRLISQQDPKGRKCQLEIMSDARTVYVAFPLFHVAGFALSSYLLFSGTTLMFGYYHRPPSILMLQIAMRDSQLDGALLPPSIVEELSENLEAMNSASKFKWIFTGGGSISQKKGDTVVTKTQLFNGLGSTECGSFIQYSNDPSHWNYFHFHPLNGIHWRPIDPEAEGNEPEFEMVIRRDRSLESYQSVFHNFPELNEWHTKDVFKKHPTEPDLWKYGFRIDDIIVFSTGEKMNPVGIESRLGCIPGIKAALVIGNKQRYPGLILEVEGINKAEPSYSNLSSKMKNSVKDALDMENSNSSRDSHIHESMILIANKEKPFVRTPKGTIYRNKSLEQYKTEIDELYSSHSIPSQPNLDDLDLDLTSEESLTSGLAHLIAKILPNTSHLGTDDDIFAAGMDSKQAQMLTAAINNKLASQPVHDIDVGWKVEIGTIYGNPTLLLLGRSILRSLSALFRESGDQENFDEIWQRQVAVLFKMGIYSDLRSRYSHEIPTATTATTTKRNRPTSKHVLLTGTTGFIGSHTLEALLRQKHVRKVTCVNRKSPDSKPTIQTVLREGSTAQCEQLEANLTEPHFGIPDLIYHDLSADVTDILHCQWEVNFNLPLKSFETNIKGVSNLIKFACDAKHKVQIIFLSSVATVKNWQKSEPIPEAKLAFAELAQTGYGQSKLIASLLLDRATELTNLPTTICRLGQISGPTKEQSAEKPWPRRDWFPTFLASSVELGCIPDSLGSANQIDWVPVDIAAEALSDLVCDSNAPSGENHEAPQSRYYHIVNPTHVPFTEFVPFLAQRLRSTEPLEVVTLQKWVDILEDKARSHESSRSPVCGISLLGFFQGLISANQRSVVMDTTLSKKRLPLTKCGAIKEEWMGAWLHRWGF